MRWIGLHLGVLLILATGGDIHAGEGKAIPGCACRLDLPVHFTDAGRTGRLLLCARSLASRPACEGGFSRERFDDTRWTLYFQPPDGRMQRLDAISARLNRYDYTALVELCRDSDSGQDQAIFSAGWSGSGVGDRRRAVFVYHDAEQGRIASLDIDAQFVADDCSRNRAAQRRAGRMALREAGRKLHESLRPQSRQAEKFGYRALPNLDIAEIEEQINVWNRGIETPASWRGAVAGAVAPPRFAVETLAQNRRWRILAVYYLESERDSWGVLLAENRETGRWFSFYDIPNGSDKRFLFLPEAARLSGDRLRLRLCAECEGWGDYKDFDFNLNGGDRAGIPRPGREVSG